MAGSPVLDFGGYTTAEKQALLTAAKARYLQKITGAVINGSSAGQSFGMSDMSVAELILLINALSFELGYPQPETRVAPNFSGRPNMGYAPAITVESPSRIEPNVGSWSDLAALSTITYPDNTVKIWIETTTGITITVRLLPGTDATDTANGIQRPNDYDVAGNARVWYQAAN